MIKVENLSKTFTIHTLNKKIIEGFRDVNFFVPKGSALGISGPSGVGKSSILKCIYRTYIPTNGDIWYDSSIFNSVNLCKLRDYQIIKIRENEIGYISQFFKVIPRVPAIDIVSEPLISDGISKQEAQKIAKDLLKRLGITENLFDAYPSTFSGGEQQRVNIARAVIKMPRLLLLDEPTASLDTKSTKIVLEILNELKSAGCTMIGIFHDPDLLKKFSDQIYELNRKEAI